MKKSQRVFSVVSIVLCGLILVLCVGGLIGTWVIKGVLTDVTLDLLSGVEKITQASQSAIERVDLRLAKLIDLTGNIESATTQLSQNVADQGLVLTLLPEEK